MRCSRHCLHLLVATVTAAGAETPFVDPTFLAHYRAALETGVVGDHVSGLAPVTRTDYADALARAAPALALIPDGDGLLLRPEDRVPPATVLRVELAAAELFEGTRGSRRYADAGTVETGLQARVYAWRSVSWGRYAEVSFGARGEVGHGGSRLRWPGAAITLHGSGVALTLGRQPRWWGPGTLNEVLLTTNAQAGDGIGFGTDGTQRLPLLGPVRMEVSLLRLDDADRPTPNPLLFAHCVATRPRPWIELAAARTIMVGGDGRTSRLTWSDAWDIFLGRRENRVDYRGPKDTDQKVQIDGTLYLYPLRRFIPFLQGGCVYLGYAGDDAFKGLLPTRVAHNVGGTLLFPRTRIEVAYFGDVAGGLWYWNDEYPAGYTVHGNFIGSDVGWDGKVFRSRVTMAVSRRVGVRAELFRDTRGYRFHQGDGLEPERGGDKRTTWEAALRATLRASHGARWSLEWRHRNAHDGFAYDADRQTAEHVVRLTWQRR